MLHDHHQVPPTVTDTFVAGFGSPATTGSASRATGRSVRHDRHRHSSFGWDGRAGSAAGWRVFTASPAGSASAGGRTCRRDVDPEPPIAAARRRKRFVPREIHASMTTSIWGTRVEIRRRGAVAGTTTAGRVRCPERRGTRGRDHMDEPATRIWRRRRDERAARTSTSFPVRPCRDASGADPRP